MTTTTLNRYYEDELVRLRELAAEFGRVHPLLAPMLGAPSGDPDVERLLEGVAFLTGLTRQKLDDGLPELVQELAHLLFPHSLRPVPAATLIAFEPRGALRERAVIAAGTEIESMPVDGTACRFRTCGDLVVEPIALVGCRFVPPADGGPALRLDFEMLGIDASEWNATRIRLFVGGERLHASRLFALVMQHVVSIDIACGPPDLPGPRSALGSRALRLAGFDDALLPCPERTFPGFRLLHEYFAFAEKFLFVDLNGLERWRAARSGAQFSVWLTLDCAPEWLPGIDRDSFRLNVVAALNLFAHEAVPIQHEHRATDYRLQPEGDAHGHCRIYSVDRVVGYRPGHPVDRHYVPLGVAAGDASAPSYRLIRRAALDGHGHDVHLALAYPTGEALVTETLSIGLSCTNGALATDLKIGDVCRPTDNSPERFTFANIAPVSAPLDPLLGEPLLWRTIGHLALNFLSLGNVDNLKQMLALHASSERCDDARAQADRRRIDGIESVDVRPETRVIGERMLSGQHVALRCRAHAFGGAGELYLFGCVLERFLAEYAALNTYTRVEIDVSPDGERFAWPPRMGAQCLL
ncbi:type VI secretion system protein ImpG [Burkholderia ubonensis]|uniref:type VI secretion system baseplate subunit TssF n=1 Tax=Burkholderia ubonensis TaxID=101571 RepID=UPI000752ADBB|nr:type VI secretion system baseplate subunit TssF [Burkholderia ubonensis]KWC39193.1 type VI secretion system protein ImpG [Burkholderia ubonensis]KWC40148.1 type VI secretion system protein ImpG [Burkholderia ubonensis]